MISCVALGYSRSWKATRGDGLCGGCLVRVNQCAIIAVSRWLQFTRRTRSILHTQPTTSSSSSSSAAAAAAASEMLDITNRGKQCHFQFLQPIMKHASLTVNTCKHSDSVRNVSQTIRRNITSGGFPDSDFALSAAEPNWRLTTNLVCADDLLVHAVTLLTASHCYLPPVAFNNSENNPFTLYNGCDKLWTQGVSESAATVVATHQSPSTAEYNVLPSPQHVAATGRCDCCIKKRAVRCASVHHHHYVHLQYAT